MKHSFGPQLAKAIESGNNDALLHGLVALCAFWFEQAGSYIEWRSQVGAVNCTTSAHGDLLAAACDLYDALALSPKGRKALLQFRDKPVFEEPKGE